MKIKNYRWGTGSGGGGQGECERRIGVFWKMKKNRVGGGRVGGGGLSREGGRVDVNEELSFL